MTCWFKKLSLFFFFFFGLQYVFGKCLMYVKMNAKQFFWSCLIWFCIVISILIHVCPYLYGIYGKWTTNAGISLCISKACLHPVEYHSGMHIIFFLFNLNENICCSIQSLEAPLGAHSFILETNPYTRSEKESTLKGKTLLPLETSFWKAFGVQNSQTGGHKSCLPCEKKKWKKINHAYQVSITAV